MKKRNLFLRISAVIISLVLIAAMALCMASCGKDETDSAEEKEIENAIEDLDSLFDDDNDSGKKTTTDSSIASENTESGNGTTSAEVKEIGEGATQFAFTVVYEDGKTDAFSVKTDKTMLGDALLEAGLISGSESEYGLYVDTVNGVKVVWDTDKAYWALYIGDNYAQTGVSETPVTAGGEYSFRYTKG